MTDSWTLKLDRAEEHLREFDLEITNYVNKHPYRAVRSSIKCKQHGRCWLYILEITEQPDPYLAVILGDVTHNIRSALDHMAVALVPAGRKYSTFFPIISEDVERRSWLPFRKSEAHKTWDRAIKGMRPEAVAIIREAQPYRFARDETGKPHPLRLKSQLLGVLGRLDNADKHRELIVLSSALIDPLVTLVIRGEVKMDRTPIVPPGHLVENGANLLHLQGVGDKTVRESEVDVKVRGTPQIAVEVGLGRDKVLKVEAIHALISPTRRMFTALDSYVRRPKPKR